MPMLMVNMVSDVTSPKVW